MSFGSSWATLWAVGLGGTDEGAMAAGWVLLWEKACHYCAKVSIESRGRIESGGVPMAGWSDAEHTR